MVLTEYDREVCTMQEAETVLNVLRERGERGLPLENIYRLLYNRNLYLRAYGRLYSNQGAMTKGTTADTVDGMSLAKIDDLIDALRYERFRWTPVRRVNLPKPKGGTRPLGIPTWTDKLLQEVIRMILEAYYEPQFSDRSHGFRPGRGCHTALEPVYNLFRISAAKASTTICRLVSSFLSQFFQSRRHFSSQAKDRSTTHRFGSTTKVCISLRFTTSTDAPSRLCTPAAKGSPV